jgi:type I restriction enzyme S subunit
MKQAAIVHFLSSENILIQRAIRTKKKLITLLNEEKQAIIHQAVTRGLGPGVRLKPSGVSWLGEIPEHWEIVSVGVACSLIQTGPFGSQLHSHEYVSSGIPVINPSHMRDGRIASDKHVTITPLKAEALHRHRVYSGDILVARRGELGRCALVTDAEHGWVCGTGSLLIRCAKGTMVPAYFQQVFSSNGVRDALSLASIGATMENLNAGTVGRLCIPRPPLPDQHRIVAQVETAIQTCAAAISKAQHDIDLIREYRTRLIADVVTGQVDVRDASREISPEMEQPDVSVEVGGDESGELLEAVADDD